LLQRGTFVQLEHPAWHGDLDPVAKTHNYARISPVPYRAHDLDFLTVQWVMLVTHPRKSRVMGSVVTPCATPSPPTCWKRAWTSTPSSG
jgi:hypothetical protein